METEEKKVKKNRRVKPDYAYNDVMVAKFVNHLMYSGKKSVAMRAFYEALALVKTRVEKDNKQDSKQDKDGADSEAKNPDNRASEKPLELEIFLKAIDNVKPNWEVKSQRIGGSTYQIPSEIEESRKESLAIRWLIKAARSKKGKSIVKSLSEEIVDAYNNTGVAYKKKEDTHKAAEANRAFAHYGRN